MGQVAYCMPKCSDRRSRSHPGKRWDSWSETQRCIRQRATHWWRESIWEWGYSSEGSPSRTKFLGRGHTCSEKSSIPESYLIELNHVVKVSSQKLTFLTRGYFTLENAYFIMCCHRVSTTHRKLFFTTRLSATNVLLTM